MIDPVVNQIENQCDQIWRNATSLVNILKYLAIYLRLIWFWAKFLTLFGTILYAFGQIFIAGQKLRTQSGHLVTLLRTDAHPDAETKSSHLHVLNTAMRGPTLVITKASCHRQKYSNLVTLSLWGNVP